MLEAAMGYGQQLTYNDANNFRVPGSVVSGTSAKTKQPELPRRRRRHRDRGDPVLGSVHRGLDASPGFDDATSPRANAAA